MLVFGLTRRYKVETGALTQSMKPGIDRFPEELYFSTLKTGMAALITNCDAMSFSKQIKWNADQTDPPTGGRGLKLFMIQEIREDQRCLHPCYQRSNP